MLGTCCNRKDHDRPSTSESATSRRSSTPSRRRGAPPRTARHLRPRSLIPCSPPGSATTSAAVDAAQLRAPKAASAEAQVEALQLNLPPSGAPSSAAMASGCPTRPSITPPSRVRSLGANHSWTCQGAPTRQFTSTEVAATTIRRRRPPAASLQASAACFGAWPA